MANICIWWDGRPLKLRIFLIAIAFGCTSPARAALPSLADSGRAPLLDLSVSPD